MKSLLLVLLACLLGACAQPIDASVPAEGTAVPAGLAVVPAEPPIALTVQVSEGFEAFHSVDYVAAIEAAVEQWNRAAGGRLVLTVELTDAPRPAAVLVRPATSADVTGNLIDATGLGSTACRGCWPGNLVLLNAGMIGQRSQQAGESAQRLAEYTALHELGHLLGLGHLPAGLMFENDRAGWQACVDSATLAAFCQLHGCPAAAAPTCPNL